MRSRLEFLLLALLTALLLRSRRLLVSAKPRQMTRAPMLRSLPRKVVVARRRRRLLQRLRMVRKPLMSRLRSRERRKMKMTFSKRLRTSEAS
jgi:hypothetical protein